MSNSLLSMTTDTRSNPEDSLWYVMGKSLKITGLKRVAVLIL